MLSARPLKVTMPWLVSVLELIKRWNRSDSLTREVMAASSSFSSAGSDASRGAVQQNRRAASDIKTGRRPHGAVQHVLLCVVM
jgi:hypothetical protein